MKKEYVTPQMVVVEIDSESLLTNSPSTEDGPGYGEDWEGRNDE